MQDLPSRNLRMRIYRQQCIYIVGGAVLKMGPLGRPGLSVRALGNAHVNMHAAHPALLLSRAHHRLLGVQLFVFIKLQLAYQRRL